MHIHILSKVWEQRRGDSDMHKVTQMCVTKWHTFVHNYAKGMEYTWGVRWTCINIMMHVHILTKVWDYMRGDWNIHIGPYWGMYLHTMCKGGGADLGSQVDMHTHTNECTHSYQGVRPDEWWLGHTCGPKKRHTYFCATVQSGWSRHGESVGHAYTCWCIPILTKVWHHMTGDWDMHKGLHRDAHVCTQLCKGMEQTCGVRCIYMCWCMYTF